MTTQSNQLITVEAPCDIDEGFAFDVIVEGRVFQIEVPSGGLKLGETFQASLPDIGGDPLPSQAPTGRWKDDLFDCFKHGFMHPVLWNSFCCTQGMSFFFLQFFCVRFLNVASFLCKF